MQIPTATASAEGFFRDIRQALGDARTHFYLDTSFLIWLTKLGTNARAEFLQWLTGVGVERVHVPVWASHEFLRHQVQGLIGKQIEDVASQLQTTADSSYEFLKPLLDRGFKGDSRSAGEIKDDVRQTLLALKTLAASIRTLKDQSLEHAAEVSEFVNRHCLNSGRVFRYMTDIGVLGANRFSGRVPPGFQDRGKQDEEEGSNTYGDLIFWKEILDDSKQRNSGWFSRQAVKAVVILSNDRKNDWQLSGSTMPDLEPPLRQARRKWRPLPHIHPMLALEAKVESHVDAVYVIDSSYLGAVFFDEGRMSQFVDAALKIDLPESRSAARETREALLSSIEVRAAAAPPQAYDPVYEPLAERTLDTPGRFALEKALITSRVLGDALASEAIRYVFDAAAEQKNLKTILQDDVFRNLSGADWTIFSRHLYLSALDRRPVVGDYVTDLVAELERFPVPVAMWSYMGFLAAAYLTAANEPQLPPHGVALPALLRAQDHPFAEMPIAVLRRRMKKHASGPAYIPHFSRPTVSAKATLHRSNVERLPLIQGLRFDQNNIVTDSQAAPELLFSTLFGGRQEIEVTEIIDRACRLFGIPRDQVKLEDEYGSVTYGDHTGFEDPATPFAVED